MPMSHVLRVYKIGLHHNSQHFLFVFLATRWFHFMWCPACSQRLPSHFTADISHLIPVWQKISFVVILFLGIRSLQSFAHDTAAQLWWLVQKFVAIQRMGSKQPLCSTEYWCDAKSFVKWAPGIQLSEQGWWGTDKHSQNSFRPFMFTWTDHIFFPLRYNPKKKMLKPWSTSEISIVVSHIVCTGLVRE